MSFKVVRNEQGQVVSFGPNEGWYEPAQGYVIEEDQPVIQQDYKQLRAAAYPPFTDYLDGLVKGDAEQTQAYRDACLMVKLRYPKP